MNKYITIDKKAFHNAVAEYTNKEMYKFDMNDVDAVSKIFGIDILFSFATCFKCKVLDEKTLFMNKLKYGF